MQHGSLFAQHPPDDSSGSTRTAIGVARHQLLDARLELVPTTPTFSPIQGSAQVVLDGDRLSLQHDGATWQLLA